MKLISQNIEGNLHEATSWCNGMGISDVVAMDYGGGSTVVVYRVTDEEYEKEVSRREAAKYVMKKHVGALGALGKL